MVSAVVGTVVSLAWSGCARTRVETSLAGPVEMGDVNAELDFWDALTTRPVVCNDDGLHGLLLFTDGADPSLSYSERVVIARSRNWIPPDWNEPATLAMQRGTLARAIAVHCGIEGGVMMRLLGPHPRYASRELQYLGMMGAGSEQQAFSGREFMGVVSKAQDYLLLREALARRESPEEAEEGASPDGEAPPSSGVAPSAPPIPSSPQ
jgi:hypothetical protein